MSKQEIIDRLYRIMENDRYNEIDDPLNIGSLIEDIHESKD